jgi:hypothetical protein
MSSGFSRRRNVSLKSGLPIHQHLPQAERLKNPLLADCTNPRMDKLDADFLLGLNLLGTWESKLEGIILETVTE